MSEVSSLTQCVLHSTLVICCFICNIN